MSVNIIEGPGPSSVATLVIGTGRDENLGFEACRERVGRSIDGRGVVGEAGLLDEEASALLGSRKGVRLMISGRFLLGDLDPLEAVSVPEFVDEAPLATSVFLGRLSGIRISCSPVDLFDIGGPLMVSP